MFGRKRCNKCEKKIERDFQFCPYCGFVLNNKQDYGLLGSSDDIGEMDKTFQRNFSQGIGGSIIDKMIGSAFKMVEKEMTKQMNNPKKIQPSMQNGNFELFINGKKINLPGEIAGIQVEEVPDQNMIQKQIRTSAISDQALKKAVKLPRKEAKTKLTRTSDKIIYEIDTPGLKSINNILINKLEDSIEIKAYAEKAVFFKTLPIKLPLHKYYIKEDKLMLEFAIQ